MKKFRFAGIPVLALALATSFYSCRKSTETTPELTNYDVAIDLMGLTTLPEAIDPVDNATSAEKVALGKLLFWDPIIGGEKDMACAGCHHPDFGYSDGRALPIGVNGTGLGPDRIANNGGLDLANGPIELVPRNAPTVINAAYNGFVNAATFDASNSPHFWDGRSNSFEEQSSGPPGSRSEMRGDAYSNEATFDSIVARLKAIPEYVTLFDDVFGGGIDAVTETNFNKAVSAFERSIIAINSPYDKYLAGDRSAMTEQEKHGLILFHNQGNCAECHKGPAFNDGDFHALGAKLNPESPNSMNGNVDMGKDDEFKFKTPTLRNIELTGPYTHAGMYSTLEEIVEFMSGGVSEDPNVLVSELTPTNLSAQDKADIVAFLKALTDNDFDKTIPESVPSGLPVGGSIN